MSRIILGALFCASGLSVLAGCGGSTDPNRPKTVPATVVVTYNGQPISGATVTFRPAASQARGASTVTDDQGRAEMWAYEPGGGVIPGAYKVSVSKVAVVSMPDPDSVSPEEYARAEEKAASAPPKHEVPEKYSDADKSGLTADVSEAGENEIAFDLTD